ncbi:MAG: integrase arm-type DNA-binding domain-containing protein [Alphaproteobacteria bacterium]|nr:integrase arm-type DNA-binding domain-containing protein [Alphaproteobacteria bacterium]
MKLTMRVIDGLTCPAGRKDRLVFDDEQKGLVVRVTAGGSKTYLCQYTAGTTKRRVPLGACNGISLAAARDAAQAILGDVAKGTDPAAERKAAATAAKVQEARDALTLAVLIDDWRRLHLAGMRPRYEVEAVRALRIGFAGCLDLPAASLDRATVVKVLDGMAGASMATRTAAYGRACYGWAIKRGSLTANPFTALPLAATERRDRVLTDSELALVWNATDPTTAHGAIVRFLILTGQRREEVGGMTWDEVSPDLTTWTLPAARAKNGAVNMVPLSAPAQDLLRNRTRSSDLVFPGRTGLFNGWSKCKERLDTACGVTGWRIHDLRRTLATGLQRLGVRLEVTEAVLNHVSGSRAGIVGVYQRHDWASEKRAALEAWGQHVAAVVEGRTSTGNVVTLQRAG